MRRTIAMFTLLLLPVAGAAQVTPAGDRVVTELITLNASMREIAALLKNQSELQALDLLLKRMQFAETRVTELANKLSDIATQRSMLEQARAPIKGKLEALEAQAEALSSSEPRPEIETMAANLQGEFLRIRQRLAALAEQGSQLESELGSKRADLVAWQELVDRRLAKQ